MAYISEIHYRNNHANATGISEYVEITLSAAEVARASDFDVQFYQGDGDLGNSYNLGDYTPVLSNGVYIYTIYQNMSLNSLNNNNDFAAVALGDNGTLLDFYDIEGSAAIVLPTTGIAAGATPVVVPFPTTNSIHIDHNGNITVEPASLGVSSAVCFTKGTVIAAEQGDIYVEDLKVGDRVLTADRGYQEIRWIGHQYFSKDDMLASPNLYPVKICKDSIREGVPARDLSVSPHHRVLVQSAICERMFGDKEVFIEAKHLAQWMGFERDRDVKDVHYYHILFDHHEVIYADGAPCESLHLGEQAMDTITEEGRAEIMAIFPEVFTDSFEHKLARVSPPNKRQKELLYRHAKNLRPLMELAG